MEYLIWNYETLREAYPKVCLYLNKFYSYNIKEKDHIDYNRVDLLNEVIGKNILEREIYEKKWKVGFLDKLSKKINYEIIDATHGLVPNFGGRIILNKSENNSKKELLFFVSLITNYYSIQIINIDKYIISNEYFTNKEAMGVKKIVVSPLEIENGSLFIEIEKFICSKIDNAKFLPFKFDTIKLEKFEVPYKYVKDFSTVSDAFFHKGLTLHKDTEIIGNIEYKIDKI